MDSEHPLSTFRYGTSLPLAHIAYSQYPASQSAGSTVAIEFPVTHAAYLQFLSRHQTKSLLATSMFRIPNDRRHRLLPVGRLTATFSLRIQASFAQCDELDPPAGRALNPAVHPSTIYGLGSRSLSSIHHRPALCHGGPRLTDQSCSSTAHARRLFLRGSDLAMPLTPTGQESTQLDGFTIRQIEYLSSFHRPWWGLQDERASYVRIP
ncbi:hypothetical protein GGR52DRAFT_392296 [Hypoxylon sp. FL1284]|nr:hypothetical protein GGR52DRAFT_392296 [Hypoxylon sp. FL1284]